MRKALLIMAAALMTLAQCRKQETVPAMPSANTIKMTVTAGPGAKTNITDEGKITWTSGDVLYVSDGTNWLGSLTLVSGEGNVSGTFTGTIQGIGDGVKTCHFFYLGKGIVTTTPSGTTDVSISFASQDGSRDGALKYHLGHGSAEVTVSEGVATGAVAMRTEIAIAHLKLKMDGADYKGKVTMDVSNTMTVNPNGTFSGSDKGINIGNNGESGDRYVTLIPTTGTESVDVTFSGSATGSLTFGHGIQANNLYGMANGIEVTLAAAPSYLPGEFTINTGGTKVKFSKGSLYWDGSAFRFEANQWSFASTWDTLHVNHFLWSKSASVAYAATYSDSGATTSDEFFTNSSSFQVAGEEAGTWRTLSKDEWGYLLINRSGNRFAKAKVNGVTGLLIFPDGYSGTTSGNGIAAVNNAGAAYPGNNIPDDTWASMESDGAVFLPAAGARNKDTNPNVINVGTYGNSWSSTTYWYSGHHCAYGLNFGSDFMYPANGYYDRSNGMLVRLVLSVEN